MEVLNEIASLDSPLAGVQEAIQGVAAAQQPGSGPLAVTDALSSLERATDTWLDSSERVESVLLRYVRRGDPEQEGADERAEERRGDPEQEGADERAEERRGDPEQEGADERAEERRGDPEQEGADERAEERRGDPEQGADERREDAADAVERLGGVSLINLAVASDLAKLVPIDALGENDLVSAADPVPESVRPSAIQAVAGDGPDEGGVLRAITVPAQQADDEDDNDPEVSSPRVTACDVLTKLVDHAGSGVRSVLVGIAPSPHVVFLAVRPALDGALGLAPDAIARAAHDVVRSIRRLAILVLRRVRTVINEVTQGHSGIVRKFLEYAQPQELVLDPAVRSIVALILSEKEISAKIGWAEVQSAIRIVNELPPIQRPDHTDALHKILKHNKRWVERPVPILARTLHPLWAVPIGPVPAAPIAACLLLAWTILFTGDQLDAPGAFPNFWHPGLMSLI